eukprot:1484165-Amphidinium_carterae.2
MHGEGLPMNASILSSQGYVNSAMADGGLDGDLNLMWFSAKLDHFMRYTQKDVDAIFREDLAKNVKAGL